MDQQADVEIHFTPADGLIYFQPMLYAAEHIEGVEIVDLSGSQDLIKVEYDPPQLQGPEIA